MRGSLNTVLMMLTLLGAALAELPFLLTQPAWFSMLGPGAVFAAAVPLIGSVLQYKVLPEVKSSLQTAFTSILAGALASLLCSAWFGLCSLPVGAAIGLIVGLMRGFSATHKRVCVEIPLSIFRSNGGKEARDHTGVGTSRPWMSHSRENQRLSQDGKLVQWTQECSVHVFFYPPLFDRSGARMLKLCPPSLRRMIPKGANCSAPPRGLSRASRTIPCTRERAHYYYSAPRASYQIQKCAHCSECGAQAS